MRRPTWTEQDGECCQWPKCRQQSTIVFALDSVKWATEEHGLQLCDWCHGRMNSALQREVALPFAVGRMVHTVADQDYPSEEIYVHDWYLINGRMIAIVSDNAEDTDFQEIDSELLQENPND